MTKGKAGHYWQRTIPPPFTPFAVVLTGAGTYAVPAGAMTMEAWAVGGGSNGPSEPGAGGGAGGAGGVAYRSWSVGGGGSVAYSASGYTPYDSAYGTTSVTFAGTTIQGRSAYMQYGGNALGGTVNVNGGNGIGVTSLYSEYHLLWIGGAVGGNGASPTSCYRRPATDVSGLLAAVAIAGEVADEACADAAAFGSGASWDTRGSPPRYTAGYGGGGAGGANGGSGAVVLYFY